MASGVNSAAAGEGAGDIAPLNHALKAEKNAGMAESLIGTLIFCQSEPEEPVWFEARPGRRCGGPAARRQPVLRATLRVVTRSDTSGCTPTAARDRGRKVAPRGR